jgi:predicted ArsR family transcriptional regulator
LAEDAPISLDELSELVGLTKEIVKRHHLVLKNADYLFLELHDAHAFFNAASGYIDHVQDVRRAIGL